MNTFKASTVAIAIASALALGGCARHHVPSAAGTADARLATCYSLRAAFGTRPGGACGQALVNGTVVSHSTPENGVEVLAVRVDAVSPPADGGEWATVNVRIPMSVADADRILRGATDGARPQVGVLIEITSAEVVAPWPAASAAAITHTRPE